MSLPLPAALMALSLEWMILGWISGIAWPRSASAPRAIHLALYLLVGAVLTGLSMLLAALVRLPVTSVLPILGIAAGLALAIRAALRTGRATDQGTAARGQMNRREQAGWALLALVLGAATIRSALVPETGWDAYSFWGLRAKAVFVAGTLVTADTAHEYYPPLASLLEAWLHAHRGVAEIDEAKVIWALVGSAFVACVGWHLRLALSHPWHAPYFSLLLLLGSVQLLDSFWTGQADLSLTTFLTLAALALLHVRRSAGLDAGVWLAQVALFAGAAALSKYEGLARLAVIGLAFGLDLLLWQRGRRLGVQALACLVGSAALSWGLWLLFGSMNGIGGSDEHMGIPSSETLTDALRALGETFGGLRTGGGLAVVGLTLLLGASYALARPWRFLTLAVVGEISATLLGLLTSTGEAADRTTYNAATRLAMQFSPLALFLAAICLSRLLAPPDEREEDSPGEMKPTAAPRFASPTRTAALALHVGRAVASIWSHLMPSPRVRQTQPDRPRRATTQ